MLCSWCAGLTRCPTASEAPSLTPPNPWTVSVRIRSDHTSPSPACQFVSRLLLLLLSLLFLMLLFAEDDGKRTRATRASRAGAEGKMDFAEEEVSPYLQSDSSVFLLESLSVLV